MHHRLILALIILGAAMLPATSLEAQGLTITITPSEGPSGTTVTIRGRGAPANSPVLIGYVAYYFDFSECALPSAATEYTESSVVRADVSGSFTFSHRVERADPDNTRNVYLATIDERTYSNIQCFRFTASGASRLFPETGHTVSGRFLEFWDDNGGLSVFGYPLNEPVAEQNRDTRRTYVTQWFERNRFEAHPENKPPYDVLLGRLGADRLAQIGRDWRTEGREPGPKTGECLWFPETGHNVCNQQPGTDAPGSGFASYWEAIGLEFDGEFGTSYAERLALFGLPLTAERMERNPDGDLVLTQWFERARFEWHLPTRTNEGGGVLLGRLGDEVRRPECSSAETRTGLR